MILVIFSLISYGGGLVTDLRKGVHSSKCGTEIDHLTRANCGKRITTLR